MVKLFVDDSTMSGSLSRLLVCISILAGLASCGGGGGDAAQPPQGGVDAAAAWKGIISANNTWMTSGRGSDGRDYVLTLQSALGTAAAYPRTGQPAATSVHRATVRVSGIEVSSSSTNFMDSSGNLFGVRNEDGSCESVNPPAAGSLGVRAVGSSGALTTGTEYAGCAAGSSPRASNVYTWSVQSDAGVVLFCVEQSSSDMAGILKGTEQNCFEAAPDGTLGTRARISINVPGVVQVVARNY